MKNAARLLLALLLLVLGVETAAAQDVAIFAFTIDATGRVQIEVEPSAEHYFVLYVRTELPNGPEKAVSMTLGEDGDTTMVLTESLAALPREHYRVARMPIATPDDLDGDGIDDLAELESLGRLGPLNPAEAIAIRDGTVAVPDRETFETLSYQGAEVLIDTHLEDLEFVKFYLLDANTDNPKLYFMNTETHRSHGRFARAIGLSQGGGGRGGGRGGVPNSMRGEIVYHPHVLGPNGTPGVYRFEFEPNDSYGFEDVRMAYELIAKNMPLLRNNFAYYPMPNAALPKYEREKALYDASRVAILLEEDLFADVGYVPLNLAEGYGLLRVMALDERPGPRDIVVYEALPNELSRVGGIITTVPQTPLSHVNLRAIQDRVPNAYIRDALDDPVIAALVGQLVHYRVAADGYTIREATLAEVEDHYSTLRPTDPQTPVRDLSTTAIAPLDEVGFDGWSSFGVKAANMSTMRGFGFPEGVIRDGFAVPFYFYDAFMKHNGFYEDVQALLADPAFTSDYDVQVEALEELRDDIEDGDMPQWMLDALDAMHASYPAGTPLRCRSSTNNEDLPGFSGAGLYDSYTHREDEGHIAKSIKQVYASLWNFRAFDERQFYRIDHFQTAMAVLVHENFDDEQANGVAVTTDPVYGSEDTYYLNTQVGENLVTNPDALSIPEEILLSADPRGGYQVMRPSNQVASGEQVLSEAHLDELRSYLGVIDARFRELYLVPSATDFAMEIEYKVTREGALAIKQARPWLFAGGRPISVPEPDPAPLENLPIYLPLATRGPR